VNVYILGGNSRTNASIALVMNNASATVGNPYLVDISTEAIIVALPVANKNTGSYAFTYTIKGEEYNWWEKLIYGPDGELYFWVAIGCAIAVGILIIAVLIVLIVKCCRRGSSPVSDANKGPSYTQTNKDSMD